MIPPQPCAGRGRFREPGPPPSLRKKAFTSSPFIKSRQLLWFADTLNANTTMPLLFLPPPHLPYTHILLQPYPPFTPSSNTKLHAVAMATAGVHKSELRGTLQPLEIIMRISGGTEGGDVKWRNGGQEGGDPQDG